MTTNRDECACEGREGDPSCRVCAERAGVLYWCDVCERPVREKRCPLCGLKARKMREE